MASERIRPYGNADDLEQLRSLRFPERLLQRYCCLGLAWRILRKMGISSDLLFVMTPADSNRIVGTVVLNRKWACMRSKEAWTIHALFVVPELRRSGCATALLEHVNNELNRRHARIVRLKASMDNVNAIKLYVKVGFVRERTVGGSAIFANRLVYPCPP
jgi:ribosomal protein S18 acetylase RimI-like enzyme